jgi:protein-tyrosine phosphatase
MDLSTENVNRWHRTLCEVTPWLTISGDLSPDPLEAEAQLKSWVDAGITDVVDVRGEWSDEEFVTERFPQIGYHYLGTHDDGTNQDLAWFQAGLAAMETALAKPTAKLLVHCHMGINRGPSMAFAMLLAKGYEPIPALDAIRNARPIAGIIYAQDALAAVCQDCPPLDLLERERSVRQWFQENYIDVSSIIRKIRSAE